MAGYHNCYGLALRVPSRGSPGLGPSSCPGRTMRTWRSSSRCTRKSGVAGRRFAGLEPRTRTDFLRQVRSRLEKLSPADFIDRSEVIAAVAVAQ